MRSRQKKLTFISSDANLSGQNVRQTRSQINGTELSVFYQLLSYIQDWKNHYQCNYKQQKDIFTLFGKPKMILLHSGPQFSSVKFANFVENKNIGHNNDGPFHQRANGSVRMQLIFSN